MQTVFVSVLKQLINCVERWAPLMTSDESRRILLDHSLPESLEVCNTQTVKEVDSSDNLKGSSTVVVLQGRDVIVSQCKFRSGVYLETSLLLLRYSSTKLKHVALTKKLHLKLCWF